MYTVHAVVDVHEHVGEDGGVHAVVDVHVHVGEDGGVHAGVHGGSG